MNQLVFKNNNQAVTSSRNIARDFEKGHREVLRSIDDIIKNGVVQNYATLFYETTYIHEQNKQEYRQYLINRDGFTLLVMGFTGKQAMQFKLNYMNAFNRMEQELVNQKPKNALEVLQGTIEQLVEQDKKLKQLDTKVNNISNIVTLTSDDWRDKVNSILKKIARNWTGVEPYRSVKNLSYERLEKRAKCKLNIRLNNRKERALAQGMSKAYVQRINKLDCIAEEQRLVEIYLQVVKEMAIQFNIDINDFEEVI